MYNNQTDNPLYKGFTCPYCGKTVRTRQGLSGHIQFKHGTKKTALQVSAADIVEKKAIFKAVEGMLALPKSTTQMIELILDNWLQIVLICDALEIALNKQDFKNYIVAGLASIYQS